MDYKLEDIKNMKFKYEYMSNIFKNDDSKETKPFKEELNLMIRVLDELLVKLENEVQYEKRRNDE